MPLGSWYSQLPAFGWFDREDRPGSNALGVPDAYQGIALPNRNTLGKWFNVTPPGGGLPFPMQQTDVGPSKWTGRGVDISAAAAHQMGYTPRNFPTDSNWKIEPRDEPRGLGSPAGLPVQAGDVPDNTDETAVASGPPQGRKMPQSLMDMFQPQDYAGKPIGFDQALQQNSGSLLGLGLGLLQPRSLAVGAPVGNAWTSALEGYQAGAAQDQRRNYQQAQLAHQKTQEARQAAQDRLAASHWTQQFAENQLTDAEKLARAAGIQRGTPEHQAFIQKAIQSKTEGDWKVVEIPHPDYPDQKVPIWANARTRETAAFTPGHGPPGTTGVAVNPDTFAKGTPPVYGVGGDFNASPAAALPPSGGGAPTTAPGRAFPPPQPGMNSKVYAEEMTKRAVKDQVEQDRAKKQAGGIDPVKEDIAQAIKIIQTNPASTTGKYGQLASYFGGQAGDLSGLLETVKARVSFDELNRMRQASPTGGALGNVSDKDMKSLQAVMGSLEQARTPEQLLYNLDRIDRVRHEIIHGPGTAPPPRFAPPDAGASARKTASPKIKPGFIDPDFPDQVFKGGDPASPDSWVKKR